MNAPNIETASLQELLALIQDSGLDHETRHAVESRLAELAGEGCACCICEERNASKATL